MARFNEGDVVVINKTQIGTVRVYDEETGQVVLVVGQNPSETIYGHKSNFDLELLVKDRETVTPEDETPVDPEPAGEDEGPQDELTTSGLV